jgi:membrane-associated phospholipid phosphatase
VHRHLLAALFAVALAASQAEGQRADSSDAQPPPLLTRRDGILTAAFTVASIALMQVDERIAIELARPSVQEKSVLRSLATGAKEVNERTLFLASIAGYAVGRLAQAPVLADVSLHAGEAIFISSAGATVVRGLLGRSRPFVTGHADPFDYHYGEGFAELKYRAFPSIHASASFATAAVLSAEVARHHPRATWYVAPVLYGAASLPGLARMYNDQHWASDVLMGAFVGTLTGVKVVRYHHSRPGNRLDRILLGVLVVPDERGGVRIGVVRPL